jgi:hypothetical protein
MMSFFITESSANATYILVNAIPERGELDWQDKNTPLSLLLVALCIIQLRSGSIQQGTQKQKSNKNSIQY